MLFSALLLFCVQACLVQRVFSQYAGPYAAGPAAAVMAPSPCNRALDVLTAPFVSAVTAPMAESFLAPTAADAFGAYGGGGIGETAVAGEIPAEGTTAMAGQVPILGAVEFGGIVSAAGTVSIAGTCACRPGPF